MNTQTDRQTDATEYITTPHSIIIEIQFLDRVIGVTHSDSV